MTQVIDWSNFTPFNSLMGGMLIGLSSSLLVIFRGKIAGISGILGAVIQTKNIPNGQHLWRFLFLLGLMSSSLVYQWVAPLPKSTISASIGTLIIAGLLVGFGTRMGSGCTSGHGICGLSRLSLRSLVATACFMGSGFIVCYFTLHVV